jgi:hypothetical protein
VIVGSRHRRPLKTSLHRDTAPRSVMLVSRYDDMNPEKLDELQRMIEEIDTIEVIDDDTRVIENTAEETVLNSAGRSQRPCGNYHSEKSRHSVSL